MFFVWADVSVCFRFLCDFMYVYIYIQYIIFCIHLFLPVVVSRSCIHCFQGALKLQDLQVFLTKPYYSNKDRQRSTYLGAGDI